MCAKGLGLEAPLCAHLDLPSPPAQVRERHGAPKQSSEGTSGSRLRSAGLNAGKIIGTGGRMVLSQPWHLPGSLLFSWHWKGYAEKTNLMKAENKLI